MPDNLRITTPITTNESIGKLRPNKEPSSVDVVDPSKVSSRNETNQSDQKNTLDFTWDRRSVFQKFVERLQQTPGLSQTLQKLMLGTLEKMLSAEDTLSTRDLLGQLMESIKMDQPQILENLLFQQEHSTKFSGELFQVLRNLSQQGASPELEARLGRFLKAFDGYFSAPDTMKAILNELKDILQYIPKSARTALETQMGRLEMLNSGQNLEENLRVLKEQLIPTLGKYIASSNDFGEVRNKITLLLHDISRLNVSSQPEVVSRFQELLDFCQYEMNVPTSVLNRLQTLFVKQLFEPDHPQNKFIDSLIKMLTGQGPSNLSSTSQGMVRDTVNALLLDNSVYMPFQHLFLPVQYNGAFLFSEIWVEKDAERSATATGEEAAVKLFLTFDVKNLGSFDASITLRDRNVIFQLHYPESLSRKDYEIRQEMSRIFTKNGFTPDSILAAVGAKKSNPEILRKIYEKRQSVDVTV